MTYNDNSSWVFDSLVGFLHGPIWNIPLQTFIEEKSLTFEPTDNGEVIERPEYKDIHEEYKNLVDIMLGSFMDDIGITADQFEAACRLSASDLAGLPAHFHRRLFEQIWAANDYSIFVKMMTHKNVELQLQALELIEKRFGALPSLFSAEGDDEACSPRSIDGDWAAADDDVMTELQNLQLADSEGQNEVEVGPDEVVAEKKSLLSKLHSFENKEATKNPADNTEENVAKNIVPQIVIPKSSEVSEEEMKARQEYLKQQRDKLLALKKQVRQRRLGEQTADNYSGGEASGPARPRSARLAAAAVAGAPLPPPPPHDALSARRALADKLKTEVVLKH